MKSMRITVHRGYISTHPKFSFLSSMLPHGIPNEVRRYFIIAVVFYEDEMVLCEMQGAASAMLLSLK